MHKLFFAFVAVALLFASLISVAHSYSRVDVVKVNAVSTADVGKPVMVRVDIHTGNNRYEWVWDVRATFLPLDGVNLTSGVNPMLIGAMGPGPADASCNWTIAFSEVGTYDIVVNVTCVDTQLMPRWLTNSTSITVYDSPHAEFSVPDRTYANQSVVLDASKSYARGPELRIVSYEWRFGDGETIKTDEAITEHVFSSVGNYTVSLNVTDDRASSSTASAGIIVSLFGDVNFDGKIDILDFATMAYSFQCRPGEARWNPECDLNGDDVINIIDLSLVATR